MALILKTFYQGYFWIFDELKDPRVDSYPLMSSELIPLSIILVYLYFVKYLGPALMKNRPPFKLDRILLIFNFVQVLANTYLILTASSIAFNSSWTCEPIDYSMSPKAQLCLKSCYIYFLLKLSDLFDTVFFVLRKKHNHISFLHTYHHFGMLILAWGGFKFLCGGHSLFLGWVNCIVHTVMYFYYFLTVLKPELKSSIWWKKYITQIQLLQFAINIFIYGQLLFWTDCKYPKFVPYVIVPQNFFMICLFSDFYYKTYIRPRRIEAETPARDAGKDSKH